MLTTLSLSMAAAAPAFATPVTVPTTVTKRTVFGDVTLNASGLNAATINCQVETGVGTGVYTTVQTLMAGIGLTSGIRVGYSFGVPAGRRYQFTQGGLGGVTETISLYNTEDLG